MLPFQHLGLSYSVNALNVRTFVNYCRYFGKFFNCLLYDLPADLGLKLLKFTLKLYRRSDADLYSYLQKLKQAGSEYVVKIYEVIHEPETSQLLVIQEAVPYGNLADAIARPRRLEDEDALTLTKQFLNGHIDLLRNGVYWSGT